MVCEAIDEPQALGIAIGIIMVLSCITSLCQKIDISLSCVLVCSILTARASFNDIMVFNARMGMLISLLYNVCMIDGHAHECWVDEHE